MYLIQLLLPVYDNDGRRFPPAHHKAVKDELAQRFGGLTAYTQAPAEGLWSDDRGVQTRDDIVVYEIMAEGVDEAWWRAFRERLEQQFEQREVVVRAHAVTKL